MEAVFVILVAVIIGMHFRHLAILRDLAQLNLWRQSYSLASQWMAEFPDAATALAYMADVVDEDVSPNVVSDVRAMMRARRDLSS